MDAELQIITQCLAIICDLVIDGQLINLWALHKAVFSWNGFESVRLL